MELCKCGLQGLDMTHKTGDIYLIRNRTWFSKLIRFWTRSRFDHAGMAISDTKGVEMRSSGITIVELADINGEEIVYLTPVKPLTVSQKAAIKSFLVEKIKAHSRYDWPAILGFILFKRLQHPKRFFCFELVWAAYESAGAPLGRLDIRDYVDGRLIYSSLALEVKE